MGRGTGLPILLGPRLAVASHGADSPVPQLVLRDSWKEDNTDTALTSI